MKVEWKVLMQSFKGWEQEESGVTPVTITDHSQGPKSTWSSSGMWHHCLAMGRPSGDLGDTLATDQWSWWSKIILVIILWSPSMAVWLPRPQRSSSHTTLWDIQAMSAVTDTEKLKRFLPHEKAPESFPQNDWEIQHISTFSSSGASAPFHFPVLFYQMDARKQRKIILNSPPAKPWSKPGYLLLFSSLHDFVSCLLVPVFY